MTDPANPYGATQQQMLDLMRQSQEAFMNAVNAWTEMLGQMTPGQSATGLQDVVDRSFDSAQRVLEAQRSWAHDVLRSTQSATGAAQDMVRQGMTQAQQGMTQAQQNTRAAGQAGVEATETMRRETPRQTPR